MVAATFQFEEAQVLVTGGSNGIGLGVARAFSGAGAHVTITGTRSEARDYEHDLGLFSYRRLSMTDGAGIARLVEGLDGLDILVNNAGANLPGGRSEWDPDVFEEVVAVNLAGAFRLTTSCKDLLSSSTLDGGASVINMGSMTSFFGLEIVPGYGAAKAAVVQMTKGLAVAWARDRVRVNAVAPGVVESNMTAPMLAFDELTKPLLDRTPMGRFGTPEDIAPVILFLASPAARYITGQTIAVDGGFSIQG